MTDPAGNSGARVLCGVITPMRAASVPIPKGAILLMVLAAAVLVLWLLLFRR
jgi:hypothetical protein